MPNKLNPTIRGYLHGANITKRYIRVEEIAVEFGLSPEEMEAVARAAGALYKLTRICLVHRKRVEDYMKHLYKVPGSNKQVIKKFVRIGEKKEKPKEEKAVGYSADNVVKLVISKCEAGGMITTEHNLDRLLADGSITKEDYDDCYPLDGLENSYYSVFVNVDLNKASTTSGKALKSEGEITDYIAGMLLLESDSIFNIRNAGVTKTGGESFYEFRCYR